MAVTPINVARVTENLEAFRLLQTLRAGQLGLFRAQNQIATGLRFQAPSEDPARAAAAGTLDRAVDRLRLVRGNVQTANAVLASGEAAMQDAIDLLREAHATALEAVNDTNSADTRRSLASLAESMLEQLTTIANRKHLSTFLFGGSYGQGAPFERITDGVLYHGDDGRLFATVDSDLARDSFTISGQQVFRALSSDVRGIVDLDPALTLQTRISDLRGATGAGVTLGRIAVMSGTTQTHIDLSGCATIGDVIDRLNAEMPADLTATITSSAIQITSSVFPGDIAVTDVANGRTAVELGIVTTTRVAGIVGRDLDPRLTPHTRLSALNGGAGVVLNAGITIRNGATTAFVSFDGCQTIEDVLNRINQSRAGVCAQIDPLTDRISVLNRVSGSEMRIEEAGGSSAQALGIRSQHGGTTLAELNDGRGVQTVAGADFRITTRSGATIDIDLDALDLTTATLQDVIDLLNAQGGGAITASLSSVGNGIRIADNTTGAGTLRVDRLNLSPAIDGLGLQGVAAGGVLVADDVNPAIVDSPFTALLELQRGLDANDTRQIQAAGVRLKRVMDAMQSVQGRLAAKAKTMLDRGERIESEMTTTRVLQSDVRDADLAESIVRFQQLQTALQANLTTAGRLRDLSLLNYLR